MTAEQRAREACQSYWKAKPTDAQVQHFAEAIRSEVVRVLEEAAKIAARKRWDAASDEIKALAAAYRDGGDE